MDTNTIVTIGMFIPIIIGLAAILKFLFQMKNELHEFKIMANERFARIEAKLELSSKDYGYTNKRMDDVISSNNIRFDKLEDYNKNIVTQVLDKINIQTGQPVIN